VCSCGVRSWTFKSEAARTRGPPLHIPAGGCGEVGLPSTSGLEARRPYLISQLDSGRAPFSALFQVPMQPVHIHSKRKP